MISIEVFAGKKVFVFGLGDSGIASARALRAGGAEVLAFDDNRERQEEARRHEIIVQEPHEVDWSSIEALILAPGIPLTHPEPHYVVRLAKKNGVKVIGDIELFSLQRAHFLQQAQLGSQDVPFIAITGTNGKSTTTSLIAHILETAGYDVQVGGNIGTPILDLKPFCKGRIYVIECSSFQIELAPSIAPSIAILLNITPDHIDRHGSFSRYKAIKASLLSAAEIAVVAVDTPLCKRLFKKLIDSGKKAVPISAFTALKNGYFYKNHNLYKSVEGHSSPYATLEGISSLRGMHNAQNTLMALVCADLLSVDKPFIQKGLQTYQSLPHRMQEVRRIGRTVFINDSKATNADASAPALATFDHIYWIIGGLAKEGGINALQGFFPKISKAYLIGEAAEDFSKTIAGAFPFSFCGTLEKAVAEAAKDALADPAAESVVLLSPACASYDQFKNYSARGAHFVALVNAL